MEARKQSLLGSASFSIPLSPFPLLLALSVLVLALLVPPAGAENGPPSVRLDPTLRQLVREVQSTPRRLAEEQRLGYLNVTLRAQHDVSKDVAALGGHVNTVVGDGPVILTVRLPIDRLESLARIQDVISVSASNPVPTALDRSVVDIGADDVWALQSHGLPITGQGVLIGVVDTGIDWSHSDFQNARGRSRIVAIWDQTSSGTPPAGFDYGTEWRRWQIDAGLPTEADTSGHGTHVAGVAAGSGTHYTGVAPGAELIVVKSPLDTASIIDAWNYIVTKARNLGRSVVMNNSFGAHFGAHDGSADYELALDALSGPGVIFAAAAGNEGQTAMHASGRVPFAETITLPFSFFEGYPRAYADINVWYESSDSLSISVTAPTGQTFGPVEKGALRIFGASDGTEITVDAVSAPWPANGDNWARIRLDAAGGQALQGDWSIALHGDRVIDGRFDAWLPYGPYDKVFFGNYIDSHVTIREPATASRAISAGAYVTKTCWTAIDDHQYCDVYTEGEIYSHSSRGPTRDGRPRPDLSAPGIRVFAPRSANAPADDIWGIAPDNRHEARVVGTSVSTAHLTGVIALMLQVDPTLDPGTVRSILRSTARQDSFTETGSDRQWGAGKLDALAAVRAVQERVINVKYIPLVIRKYRWQPTPTPTVTPTRTPSSKPRPTPLVSYQLSVISDQ
ncbi:MAG: S8 family peptidase [Anaerolineae bacterium]